MSTKITLRTILFIAVLLLIIPMIMSAAGNREAENGKGLTLDEEVLVILERMEEGLSMEDAKAEFLSLEKEYQISVEERAQIRKMIEEVNSGVLKPVDCKEQLQSQFHTRLRIKTQTPDETALMTQTQEKANVRTQSKSQTSENSD